jgi:GntR family transcriptional regulator/MocR family aminotransferase
LYRQIYEGYRAAILDRRLRARERLPSTRSLAEELQVSRIPIVNAFEQLRAEGYLEVRRGSGTYVARTLPDRLLKPRPISPPGASDRSPQPAFISRRVKALLSGRFGPWLRTGGTFNIGQPPLDHFPIRVWSRLVATNARNAEVHFLHYGQHMGLLLLREAVADYLKSSRSVSCSPDQVMIVSGSQQALHLAAQVLLNPGSPAWFEEPGYFGTRHALTLAGARIIPVPVDDEGLDVSAGIAGGSRPRAIFVTPSHQFPLGATMSARRRLQLLDWARRIRAWVVEDDYDSEYRYGNLPIASLQGLDRDSRVIYIGTFTKLLFPALRLAYVVLPATLVEAFIEAKRATDLPTPTLPQLVLSDFMREGHFARHVRKMRVLCRERRGALVRAIRRELPFMQILGDPAGMYLAASLPPGIPDREICEQAARDGLRIAPLSECYVEDSPRAGLLLGYGGSTVEEIEAGIRRLREITEPVLRRDTSATAGKRPRIQPRTRGLGTRTG